MNKREYYNNRGNSRKVSDSDKEQKMIRDQQQQQFQANSKEQHWHSPKRMISVLLESGESFDGEVVIFDNPSMPKCKIFFKRPDKRDFILSTDKIFRSPDSEDEIRIRDVINGYLAQIFEEAVMEFPQWLEKYGTKANDKNPFFNLDEIREEFKYKKNQFGVWRIAAQIGFFNDSRPQFAKFNKIVKIEIVDLTRAA